MKAMFTAEKAYSAEKDQFSTLIGTIGFSPERNNRYSYFSGSTGTMTSRATNVDVSTAADDGITFDQFKYTDATVFVPASLNAVPASTCGSNGPGATSTTIPVWTGFAQGQIDTDASLDLWSISTANRDLSAGGATCDQAVPNPSGEPANESNDVNR
jgi:type IV pilus assembly protein PilA